ncbi:MAG: hypothetical protein LBR84_05820 [Tannerella sp.]|nr:hypothetical protein [Tannerella sp.]
MQIVVRNPYRTLGLLAGATKREITRQTTSLKRYLAANVEPPVDYSFAVLDGFVRTVEDIDAAAAKLNLDDDKILAAMFWFWKGNEITDEPAFEALKDNNHFEATEIWNNLISGKEVSKKNVSAYNNLATFYLFAAFTGNSPDIKMIAEAVALKMQFLQSDFVMDMIKSATDETFKTTKKAVQLAYINALRNNVSELVLSQAQFVKVFSNIQFDAKHDFLKSISKSIIDNITAQIETARKTRTANKQDAATAGETLYKNTKDDLAQLKEIFGATDFSYSNVADKVANELLQCSIDFFNDSQEKELDNDYHEKSISLVKMAKGIAVGSLMKNKAKDNLQTLEEMKEKEIQAAIAAMQMIKSLYEDNERKIRQQVKNLEVTDFEIIMGIKSINWSAVNENIKNSIAWEKVNELLRKILSDKNIDKIKNCTNSNQKEKFVQLAEWIKSHTTSKLVINNALNRYYGRDTNSGGSGGGGGGCYIATMAYGSYDHPQVMVLRQFRDEVLDKSNFGKWFIKTYYHYSPKLVEKLKNKILINSIIRKILNQFIKIIK